MRAGLVAYFDLGSSMGLTDHAFRDEYRRALPEIGMVNLTNPLGQGAVVDLLGSQVLAAWRTEAVAQVRRPEMELGWQKEWIDLPRVVFLEQLEQVIGAHRIDVLELTVYSLGVVYLTFELSPGIPLRLVPGVLACFEFAAYRPHISGALYAAAKERAATAGAKEKNKLIELTARPGARISTDANDYQESTLLTSFTGLYRCIDPEDGPARDEILAALDMATTEPIEFEYHGDLYYDWSTCVLWPRRADSATPEQELLRILECIRIAHTSLGICEALLRLSQDEMNAQVEWYVSKERALRAPEDLNQLRTFALAVVNLTKMGHVTQASEDRAYFERFAADAHLDQIQQSITDSVEVLFNVQTAETQSVQAKRAWILNIAVVALASLTLISVTVDAYNFIRGEGTLIEERVQRVLLLGQLVLALTVLVLAFWITTSPRNRRRRQARPGRRTDRR